MFCCALLKRITFSYFLIIQLHSWAPQLRHYCVASTADLKHCRHIGTQLGCMILRFCGLALTSSIQHSSTSAGRLLPARRDALSVAPESPSEPAATRVRLAAAACRRRCAPTASGSSEDDSKSLAAYHVGATMPLRCVPAACSNVPPPPQHHVTLCLFPACDANTTLDCRRCMAHGAWRAWWSMAAACMR